MQREYEQEFPNARVYGYTLNSLIDERTVNEEGVEKMFENLDEQGVTVNAVVLNAADQGLGIKIFENPLTDFMKVINTNICWNYCIIEKASCRMKKTAAEALYLSIPIPLTERYPTGSHMRLQKADSSA